MSDTVYLRQNKPQPHPLALVPFRLRRYASSVYFTRSLTSRSQILLLSGVGPSEHLSEYGIPVAHNLPAIGDRLVDHPIVDLHFKRKNNDSLKYFLPSSISEGVQLLPVAVRYALFGDGPMATNVSFLAIIMTNENDLLSNVSFKDGRVRRLHSRG